MLKNIVLERPLAVLDLETTGTDVKNDRIIEVSVLKLLPGGDHDHRTRRVNPGVPIPPEATMTALEQILPRAYWVEINRLLVPFGKYVCTGTAPHCSTCPLLDMCAQVEITRHR